MSEDFQYGLIARSIFVFLLWITVVIGFVEPNLLPWHIGLLLFLGFGLKPLLLRTGLHRVWGNLLVQAEEVRHSKSDAELVERLERKRRDDTLRKARKLSDELPPRW